MILIKNVKSVALLVGGLLFTTISSALAGDFAGAHKTINVYPGAPMQFTGGPSPTKYQGNAVTAVSLTLKPSHLTNPATCPPRLNHEEERVFISDPSTPMVLMNVTKPTKVSIFLGADQLTGRRAELLVRQKGSDQFVCYGEATALVRTPETGTYSEVLQPGQYGIWLGLVDAPARETMTPKDITIFGTILTGGKPMNTLHIFADQP